MKHSLPLLILLAVGIPAFGQKQYPLKETADSFVFKIRVQNSLLVLEPQGETGLFVVKKDFPVVTFVRMEEADLVLEYRTGKSKDDLLPSITFRLQLPDGQMVAPQPYELSDVAAEPDVRRLAWLDAAEAMTDFDGVYTLFVRRSLMGAVNCEGPRPEFTLKKQLPHYAAGAAGVVLIGLGQVYRTQKEDYYATYQRLWREGEPAPGENDDNPLQKAQDKEKDSNICTWTGVGILAADALLFLYRHLKIKKKQVTYDKFCGAKNTLRFGPTLRWSEGMAAGKLAPGFSISFSF